MKYIPLVFSAILGITVVNCVEEGRDQSRKVNKPLWNETFADTLKRDLLMSYDKFARPTQHYNVTKVKVDLKVKHIDFDEATSIFSVYSWLGMQWFDEKLKWNKTEYGNLSQIILAQHEIWQPDITLYNSINFNDYYGSTNFVVESNGNVFWVPPALFKIFCDANLRYWPYDTHKCSLIFGSWVYNGHEIDVEPKPDDHENYADLFVENTEWKITDFRSGRSKTYYSCCPEPYVDTTYNITIVRRASIHRSVIVAPTFVIIILTLTTFFLPTDHGEKVMLNGFIALIVCIYLMFFSENKNYELSDAAYCHTFFLVSISIMISTIAINLSLVKNPRPLPWIVKKHLDGVLSDYLLLHDVVATDSNPEPRVSELREHNFEEHITSDEQQIIQQSRNGKNSTRTDYLKLSTAIDRIAFIVYAVTFTLFVLIYSI